jgi:hypothetical protein
LAIDGNVVQWGIAATGGGGRVHRRRHRVFVTDSTGAVTCDGLAGITFIVEVSVAGVLYAW